MERKFSIFFARPENITSITLEVPEDWDEMCEDERLEFLDDYINTKRVRWLEVEEYDEY